ncbi:DUF3644 domain-containing protein [Methylobacter sp. YRD-M1]|uniref:DUF3644 domain-containing protein n=1 Tax=Methylobacter sp. YRD-M1 TaxID=2911520 RepID=UPI00227B7F24|nr:DUF3644 domain-containing protein [Methylobacter sp. YRD-M1]WAK04453.1 DUF3644 domain-containing protein [Methylobacter sp. YRD-M1]
MLEKSIAAMLSAIEVYNKPDFKYREETFSVLCINAWELLLKAKVLHLSSNKLASLYVMEYRTLKTGEKSKAKKPKKNRSGNPMSINLFEAYRIITEDFGVKIEKPVSDNLMALTEIRDNSIHFVNDDLLLSLKIQELGSASLQNYLHLVKNWFGNPLSGYNFYLMPISFFREFAEAPGMSLNSCERKVLNYIKKYEEEYDKNDEIGDYNLTLRIDIKFQKVKSNSGIPVQITNDSSAMTVRFKEEEITDKYPWDYSVLNTRLTKRYSDFKINATYHAIRRELEKDTRFAYKRFLNPNNQNAGKKTFYNSNIIREFDKHYTKNGSGQVIPIESHLTERASLDVQKSSDFPSDQKLPSLLGR